jgi:hypothetical protein
LGGGNAGEPSRLSSPRPDPPNETGAAPDNGDIGAIDEAASPPPPLSAQFPYLCKKVSRQPVPDSGVRNRLPKLPCSLDILPPFFAEMVANPSLFFIFLLLIMTYCGHVLPIIPDPNVSQSMEQHCKNAQAKNYHAMFSWDGTSAALGWCLEMAIFSLGDCVIIAMYPS